MRKHLTAAKADDSGMTLVEVIVAMMIFAIIAVGVSYSTAATLRMSSDTSSREVATSLAAAEIDAVRAVADPFSIFTAPARTVLVDNTAYTVNRSAGWVSATGTTSGCGNGTGELQYKRVNVSVSWPGMLSTNSAARADTIIAPATRLNDPALGTILVSVLAADGTGSAGNRVTITPLSGGASLSSQPANTDADGCSYALGVTPGTYRVAITRTGSIDVSQSSAPTATVSVGAGDAASAAFQYDTAASFSIRYASSGSPTPAGILPSNLTTTFVSTYGTYTPSAGTPSVVKLHPFTDGYGAMAGTYVAPTGPLTGCVSVDPASWNAGTVNAKPLAAGARLAPVAAAPGGSDVIAIPMGVLSFSVQPGITAVRVVSTPTTATAGDPGCTTANTYTYTVLPAGTWPLAVPYGSWTVQEQVGGVWVTVPNSRYTEPSNAAGDIETPANVVTLDPRSLQ